MKHFIAFMTVLLLFSLLAACQEEQRSNAPLTDAQKLNLKLVNQDNVASYGAPPMIPAEHPIEIGEDLKQSENGGPICLDCHYNPDEEDVPQTLHPKRHNCIQCHIPAAAETAAADDFKVVNNFKKQIPK